MKSQELISRKAGCLAPTENVMAAAIRMRDENVHVLPVCAPGGRVLGMLTERDIVVNVDAAGLSSALCLVGNVMTRRRNGRPPPRGLHPGRRADGRAKDVAAHRRG